MASGTSVLLVATLLLPSGCAGREEPAPQPAIEPPPASSPKRPRRDAAAPARPLVLRQLKVRSGFEHAVFSEVKSDVEAHWGGVAGVRSWSLQGPGRVRKRVVEIRLGPKSPRSLSRYLAHWRKSHGCVAREVKGLPPLLGAELTTPPQLTFGGSCVGGDLYLIRVVLLEDTAYELHVDASAPELDADRLRGPMLELLSQIELHAGRKRR